MSPWDPPVAYPFLRATEPAGSGRKNIDLSGLRIELEGLEPESDAFVARRFRPYLEEMPAGPSDVRLRFMEDDGAPFLPAPESGSIATSYALRHAVRQKVLYHACPTLCSRLDLESFEGIVLSRKRTGSLQRSDPAPLAVDNLLRALLAWTALLRGGFMLHASSVVRGGRCYLFFGASGSGKSTLAALCGGDVISDDLTLVLPATRGFDAIGTPFRQTDSVCKDLKGRFPVVALYSLRKDAIVRLERLPEAIAFSDFLANLPFVVGEIDRHQGAWDAVRRAFVKLRTYSLHFRKDASFWEVIDREEDSLRAVVRER